MPEEPAVAGASGSKGTEVRPEWIWQRLFDAMVFCREKGFEWTEIYYWNVDEFKEVYHALQRNDARSCLRQFTIIGQAFGGDKKSVKEFTDDIARWLPREERNSGTKGSEDYIAAMTKGKVSLKK